MLKKRIDLTGRQFGELTVNEKAQTNQKGRYWVCTCVCGNKIVVKQSNLKNQIITSCGHSEEASTQSVKKMKAPKNKKTTVRKSSNGTGHVGVSKVELKSGTRFKANISVDGKNKHLGTFDTLAEAVEARKEAEEEYRS